MTDKRNDVPYKIYLSEDEMPKYWYNVRADMKVKPAPNHAGGLRFHGMSPILSQLYHDGYMEAVAVPQTEVFEAAEFFARCEGILPAPESSHAIKVALDEARKCKETGEEKVILIGLTGTGNFDLVAYQKYNDGVMDDYVPTDEELEASFAKLPKVE